jgi:hypothetical protein
MMTVLGFLIAVLVGIDLAILTVLILQHYGVIGPLNLPGT